MAEAFTHTQGPLEFAAKSQQDDIGRNLGISGDSERRIQESVLSAGYHVASGAFELGAHTKCVYAMAAQRSAFSLNP